MSSQEEFNRTYITSSEICARLGIDRSALCNARKKGRLAGGIDVAFNGKRNSPAAVIWKRTEIEDELVKWHGALLYHRETRRASSNAA